MEGEREVGSCTGNTSNGVAGESSYLYILSGAPYYVVGWSLMSGCQAGGKGAGQIGGRGLSRSN
jgi:hypothetical protein